MLEAIDYDELDPGIRDIVRLCRENGFDTCDSGDGVSKPDVGVADEHGIVESWACPNVAVQVERETFFTEADRLQQLLGGEWRIEATYWPTGGNHMLLAVKDGFA